MRTLRVRLMAWCAALLVALSAPLVLWLPARLDAFSRTWMESRADGIARALAGAVEAPLEFDDRVAAAAALEGLARTDGSSYAVLLRADGGVLATFGVPPRPLPAAGPTARVQGALLHVRVPVRVRSGRAGALQVGFSLAEYELRRQEARTLLAGLTAAILAAGIAGAWALGTVLARPLTRMTSVARRIAAGEERAAADLPRGGGDESGAMAAAFGRMLDELALQRARIGEMNRDLERRVEERTAELARTHAALEELKHAQEQLVVADRRVTLGRLAAGVGHEINNPLAYVHGNLVWLRDRLAALEAAGGGALPADLGPAVEDALVGTDRVRDIVRQLKTFSRGEDEDRAGPVSLREAMDVAVDMAAHEIRHRAHLVRVDGASPPVLANPVRLAQVFVNLLVNAAQAIPDGAADRNEVRVTLGTDAAGRAFAEVKDTGCGIPRENLSRLFDPFFTTKPVGRGTGLGLSISQAIVRALGGEITVESAPGEGSTFRVTLPACEPAGAEPRPPEPPAVTPAPRRARVLVVDDEPLVAAVLRRALAPIHDVAVATSARDALERVRRGERWDRIVCDLMMPDTSGMELHAALLETAPALADRMIFITGGAFTDGARAFLEAHPGPWLEKPVDLDRLRRLLHELPAG